MRTILHTRSRAVPTVVMTAASAALLLTALPPQTAHADDGGVTFTSHSEGQPAIVLNDLVRANLPEWYYRYGLGDPKYLIPAVLFGVDCSKVTIAGTSSVPVTAVASMGKPEFALVGTGTGGDKYTSPAWSQNLTRTFTSNLSNTISTSHTTTFKVSPNSVGVDQSYTIGYAYNWGTSTGTSTAQTVSLSPQTVTVPPDYAARVEQVLRKVNVSGKEHTTGVLGGTCHIRMDPTIPSNKMTLVNDDVPIEGLLGMEMILKGKTYYRDKSAPPKLPTGISWNPTTKKAYFDADVTYSGVAGYRVDTVVSMMPPASWTKIKGYGGKCLGLAPAQNAGSPVRYQNCATTKTVWQWNGDGQLTTRAGDDKPTLCVAPTGNYNGAPVYATTCNGSPEQIWRPRSGGDYYNAATDLCLDDYAFNTADDAPIVAWPCNTNTNQKWQIVNN
ncbi:ricin-type beta-trefoil lectin domain protein (plasmid) [Kitasatospora sp. NBC_00070]|uniref:ricin-type beta-trefoil lectin domain protein n=1 Tax=Kitasatospora sp. NBC_00070 TaxID=2975962 RepID=UPI002F906D93